MAIETSVNCHAMYIVWRSKTLARSDVCMGRVRQTSVLRWETLEVHCFCRFFLQPYN